VFLGSPISATLLLVTAGLITSPGIRWAWQRYARGHALKAVS
jgi:hypothetical protein